MEMILENECVVADQHLMNGILERQPAALDHLYTRYGGMLKSIIMQVLHDDSEADDVLQEVLVQVWDRAATYSSSKGKLMSWLIRSQDDVRSIVCGSTARIGELPTVTKYHAIIRIKDSRSRTRSSRRHFAMIFVRCSINNSIPSPRTRER